jgi:hypothetical protein
MKGLEAKVSSFFDLGHALVGHCLPNRPERVHDFAMSKPWQELRDHILSHPKLDEAERSEFLGLVDAAEAHQAHGLGELVREVDESVRRFEASHPQFTETADKILNYLSRMGI